ncbi:hypothetical protein IWQ61_004697 [Dispira simplex]|nr:hypothetical protein IWQ61_004697 [Dispira simplex]
MYLPLNSALSLRNLAESVSVTATRLKRKSKVWRWPRWQAVVTKSPNAAATAVTASVSTNHSTAGGDRFTTSWTPSGSGITQSPDGSTQPLTKKKLWSHQQVHSKYIAPRLPVVLCHGLFGFDTIGPSSWPALRIHYWRGIKEAMSEVGANVFVGRVPSSGSIVQRAEQLHVQLKQLFTGQSVNLVGHSMGGLDGRYLISHIKPSEYKVQSLSTICTPHRGSPFMDWCRDILGVGTIPASRYNGDKDPEEAWLLRYHQQSDSSPSTLTDGPLSATVASERQQAHAQASLWDFLSNTYHLTIHPVKVWKMLYHRIVTLLDTPAYSNLTTEFCNQYFNPSTPNDPTVAYYSFGASYDPRIHTWSSLRIPYEIIKKREGPNDGLVSLYSAKWGRYMETVSADHYDVTNPMKLSELKEWFHTSYLVSVLYAQLGSILKYYTRKSSSSHQAQVAEISQYLANEAERPSVMATATDYSYHALQRETQKKQSFDAIDFYLRLGTHLYHEGY